MLGLPLHPNYRTLPWLRAGDRRRRQRQPGAVNMALTFDACKPLETRGGGQNLPFADQSQHERKRRFVQVAWIALPTRLGYFCPTPRNGLIGVTDYSGLS